MEPPTADPSPARQHFRALDGIRGYAVVAVMVFHGLPAWLPGGFFGVDAFFVLSGYLITSLLVEEWGRTGRLRLGAFWARRARRLIPCLLLVLLFVVVYAYYAVPPGTYANLRGMSLSALFYFSNWYQIHESANYFAAAASVSPLAHTWSLAIEEQFYLVWPLVVVAVMRISRGARRGLPVLFGLCLAGCLASAAQMALLFAHGVDTTRLYFGTDTHAQCLLAGATLAVGLQLRSRRRHGHSSSVPGPVARGVLGFLGLAGLAGTFYLMATATGSSSLTYQGGFLLICLGTAAVILPSVLCPQGLLARTLSVLPLRWLGRISYGLYLWHFPIFVFADGARVGLSGTPLLAVRFAITVVVASLSYYLVERPVMAGAFFKTWKAWLATTPAVGSVLAVLLVATAGAGAYASPAAIKTSSLAAGHGASAPPSHGAVKVLLTGDSTAITLGLSLALPVNEQNYGVQVADDGNIGCGIAEGQYYMTGTTRSIVPTMCNTSVPPSQQWPAVLAGEVARLRPDEVALLAGRWEVYDRVEPGGQITNVLEPSYQQYLAGQLQLFVSIASSGGARVVLLTAPYYDNGEQPDGQPWPRDDPARVQAFNRLLYQEAARDPATVSVVNLNGVVCPDGHFTEYVGSLLVRSTDGIHFPFFDVKNPDSASPDTEAETLAFATWVGKAILPQMVAAAGHAKVS